MNEDFNFDKRYRKGICLIILTSILFLCMFFIIVQPVYAGQTMNSSLNVSEVTQHTITWKISYKTDIRATGAIFDGVEVEGFNGMVARNFTASDLEPNTTHEFCIYKDLINCESAKTLTDTENIFLENLNFYMCVLFGIVCITVAMIFNRIVGFIGLLFGGVITMMSFSIDSFALITGILIALGSVISIFWGKGE